MNLQEYQKVKNFNYLEYCDYLQNKYGIGLSDYMTRSWNRNPKISRTKEGLVAHHKYEHQAILLSDKKHAKKHPFEWQEAKNIVYCDYLEHLFLHILICEIPALEFEVFEEVGLGGIIAFIVPELNDVYSGWESKQEWHINCHNKIKEDKNVYMLLLKRFKQACPFISNKALCVSINELCSRFSNEIVWDINKNKKIFAEIMAL